VKGWLKHAFAVEPPGPAKPTPPQAEVAEKLCVEVVRRHLSTPALTFLEMSRPLNFIGAQAMHFFAPLIDALTDAEGHRHFATFLEQRGSIDYLCQRIEELEADTSQRNSSTVKDDAKQSEVDSM
jgi:hypothetical protein